MPGGRAIVGALLVIAAVFGVFAVTAGADDKPSTSYVVIAAPIDIGSRLSAADLRLEPIDLPASTASTAFTSIDAVIGAVTLAPLTGGELLSQSSILLPDASPDAPASIEFSFAIERDHAVDGALQPGELVDVLATYTDAGEGYTEVVTRGARVTTIGDEQSDTIAAPGTLVITLALASDADVLAVAHAKETASVTLVRATRAATRTDEVDLYRPESSRPGTATGSGSTSSATPTGSTSGSS